MSLQEYTSAKKKLDTHSEGFFTFITQSEELLRKAEKALHLNFPPDYRQFTLDFGTAVIEGIEIYGLTTDNFIDAGVPNVVWFTLNERLESQIRGDLLPIHDTTMGEYYALDFSKLNTFGEPKVVVCLPDLDDSEQSYPIVAENFGAFLLDLAEDLEA
ncbi:SMI1/KNR4 family protein [Periweissella cryptocerci]|uniref:SMI1/KNR4 family protein n=1 Tax=Periweissella cryptocerci TaxID=2506420 RepID=A0A4P6YSX2_9LACO|nr:SMI1/KNR4 family protein [Periweissella cryptocerci]QBO35838.1 SMI1/KNR4 family protein [Periweissella cryptocerci]